MKIRRSRESQCGGQYINDKWTTLFWLEGSGIEGVVPSLVGNMVVEFIYQHLYALCMKLHHIGKCQAKPLSRLCSADAGRGLAHLPLWQCHRHCGYPLQDGHTSVGRGQHLCQTCPARRAHSFRLRRLGLLSPACTCTGW